MRTELVLGALLFSLAAFAADLESARDRQDKGAMEAIAHAYANEARARPNDAQAHYRLALAHSYLAEICLELRDKACAMAAAEAGIPAAERAVALRGDLAEHHRVLGTLCGQIVPAKPLLGLKYGRCATESINKALELDPKSSLVHISRGVGNYYLPSALGGGVELAIHDFEHAVRLDPKSAEAYLWLGLALRRAKRNAEARAALGKALELNPRRVWARQQLEKTSAQ